MSHAAPHPAALPPVAVPSVPFLYLRHGETDWNAAGRAQGRSDIPLNATGLAQARAAAATLAGLRVDRIVASPLRRAAETARIVGDALGLPVVLDAALMEVCFGDREGEAMGPWYEAWLAGESTPAGGESFAALVARAANAIAPHLAPDATTLFVAHGALFRAIRSALGLPNDVRLANGVPLRCVPGEGAWHIVPAGNPPVA